MVQQWILVGLVENLTNSCPASVQAKTRSLDPVTPPIETISGHWFSISVEFIIFLLSSEGCVQSIKCLSMCCVVFFPCVEIKNLKIFSTIPSHLYIRIEIYDTLNLLLSFCLLENAFESIK